MSTFVTEGPEQLARVRAALGDDYEARNADDYALWRGATAGATRRLDTGSEGTRTGSCRAGSAGS